MAMTLTPSRLRVTQAKFFGDYNAGGSGVTSLASGQGIDLTPDPIVNTGTIALITPVTPTHGGTGSDLSATGGAGQYVKQVGVGANFTVGTIPYTDVSAGYVKINGTTPLTADWPAGAWKISSNRYSGLLLDINTTAPAAKAQFQYATTDTLFAEGSAGGQDATLPRVLAMADGSVGTPVASPGFTEVHQRIDGSTGTPNIAPYLYETKKTAGSGNLYNFIALAKFENGDTTVSSDVVGLLAAASTNPGAVPAAARTSYAFWGQSTRNWTGTRSVGMELDIWNSAGADAYWSANVANDPAASVNSTIGLAINAAGGNKNSVAVTFQAPVDSQWQTAIHFPPASIGTYAIDAGSLVSPQVPLRIADASAIVARDAGDTGDYSLIRAKGATNVAVGSLAAPGITTGTANTGVGNQALLATTTSSNNTGIGSNALAGNIGGQSNTAVGSLALAANTSGSYNTAVGMNSLAHVTTTTDNTAIGYNTLHANTATGNTAIGSQALSLNTSGAANTALGNDSLAHNTTAGFNTAAGNLALHATTGAQNTAVGASAMLANTSGTNNVAVGFNALATATTVSNNTCIGTSSLNKTTGGSNTATGFSSLYENTTGTDNTAIGVYSLRNSSTGTGNIAVGYSAGMYETGSNAFYVDNQDRTNTAGDKAKAILYGVMAAAAANQKLTVNGLFKLGVIPPAYVNNAAGKSVV